MRGKFHTPRESIIPKVARKVSDKLSDAVAYLYPSDTTRSRGKPAMLVFYGQQSKPIARFYYETEAQREAEVKKYFDIRRQYTARNAERQAALAKARGEDPGV
jgi:hypothetical protein